MDKTFDTLIQLIRIAIGKNKDVNTPIDTDWAKLIKTAAQQGVVALVSDGLKTCHSLKNNGLLELALPENEELKFNLLAHSLKVENNYSEKKKAISDLIVSWKEHNLDIFVLKGFAFAKYYPIPSHRQCSDFDCFIKYGKSNCENNIPAWACANEIAKTKGYAINDSEAKHSHIRVNGIHVENHQFCIGTNIGGNIKELNSYLQELLEHGGNSSLGKYLICPSDYFNALFFMVHAQNHLLIEDGLTLRHLCDWTLLRNHLNSEQCEKIRTDFKRFGVDKFALAMNELADLIDGIKNTGNISQTSAILLNDILTTRAHKFYSSKLKNHINIIYTIWHNRWKYSYFSNTSAMKMIYRCIIGHFDNMSSNI